MKKQAQPYKIPLPTPLPVGAVNVYLLKGERNTIIDSGPYFKGSIEALKSSLKKVGLSISEIDEIIITHGHVDHYGQAGPLSQRSGAKIWVHERDREIVSNFRNSFKRRRSMFKEQVLRTGVPEETFGLVDEFFEFLTELAASAEVHHTFRDEEMLRLGDWNLKAIYTPGHSSGSTCFLTPDGDLFAGDTLLRDITPNAAFGGADGKSVGMADYMRSLEKLRRIPVRMVYPGHGENFADVDGFVQNYMSVYKTRRDALLEYIRAGESTAFELAMKLFGPLPIEEIFLGLTEVLGHLEILEMNAGVKKRLERGVLRYSI